MLEENKPVSNRETHRVTNKNDGNDGFSAKLSIRVDAVTYGDDQPKGVGKTDNAHGENDAEPVNAVCCTHAPKNQTPWNQKSR